MNYYHFYTFMIRNSKLHLLNQWPFQNSWLHYFRDYNVLNNFLIIQFLFSEIIVSSNRRVLISNYNTFINWWLALNGASNVETWFFLMLRSKNINDVISQSATNNLKFKKVDKMRKNKKKIQTNSEPISTILKGLTELWNFGICQF